MGSEEQGSEDDSCAGPTVMAVTPPLEVAQNY